MMPRNKRCFSQVLILLLLAAQFPINVTLTVAQIPKSSYVQATSPCKGWDDAYKGRYQQALACFQQQLATNNPVDRAQALYSLGWVYSSLGQYEKAISFYQQALALQKQYGTPLNQAYALGSIGWAYYYLGQYSQAISIHKQALALRRSIAYEEGIAFSLGGIGRAYSAQGQYQQALALHQEQLAITRKIQNPREEAYALSDLGFVYAGLNQLTEARKLYEQAIVLQQQTGDPWGESISLSYLGDLLTKQKQPELAIAFYKQSINLTEGIRQNISELSPNEQETYLKTIAGTYRALAGLLISQERILEAQQVLELLKIQEIRNSIRDPRRGEQNHEIATNPTENQILKNHGTLIAFGKKIEQCQQTKCPQLSQLLDQQESVSKEFNRTVQQLERETRNRLNHDETFTNPKRLVRKADEIVSAQDNTVLIYPFVSSDKISVLWISQGGITKSIEVRNVGQHQLSETVLKFRQLLQTPTSNLIELQATAKQLYNWLIPPSLQTELKANSVRNLVFALDHVTRYIPTAALFDGEKYLVERYSLSTILSADLTDTQERLDPDPKKTLVLALGLSDSVAGFPPLPNVPLELNAIVQQSASDAQGIYPGLKRLNKAFDRRALRDDLTQGYNILHIATHGKFEPGNANASFLVLGDGQLFPIPDIETLRGLGKVHLVVLSACETALGGTGKDGTEIAGISYYFLNGGAKAVLASLWAVSDMSTSQLMQQFYKNLAKGKGAISKAEALRQAQLSLLYGKEVGNSTVRGLGVVNQSGTAGANTRGRSSLAHPFYWAPFILIGNGL